MAIEDLPRPRTLAMRETPQFARHAREILDLLLARGVLRERAQAEKDGHL